MALRDLAVTVRTLLYQASEDKLRLVLLKADSAADVADMERTQLLAGIEGAIQAAEIGDDTEDSVLRDILRLLGGPQVTPSTPSSLLSSGAPMQRGACGGKKFKLSGDIGGSEQGLSFTSFKREVDAARQEFSEIQLLMALLDRSRIESCVIM